MSKERGLVGGEDRGWSDYWGRGRGGGLEEVRGKGMQCEGSRIEVWVEV